MPPPTPIQPLLALLHQMRQAIERIDDIGYAAPAPGRTSGGIGGHIRHCMDHVSALLGATRSGVCEYDRRQRGTDVETSRSAAITRLAELTSALACLDATLLDDPVLVELQLEPGGAMILTRSSICRELAFVISHTIHHNALIGQMLQAHGVAVDARYGVAPSTPPEAAGSGPARRAPVPGDGQARETTWEALSCAR
jgi:hypothetical protein